LIVSWKRRIAWVLWAMMTFGLGPKLPCLYATSTTLAPEADLYLTHNNIFGSRLVGFLNYQDTAKQWTSGYYEYTVDIGLKSFFRRYVYRDPNSEKTKYIIMRLGYAYFPDMTETVGAIDEHRALTEVTFRLPMGPKWLWTQSNKGEIRFLDSETAGRYRGRLKLERSLVVMGIRMTPYAAGEGFYDLRIDQFERFLTTFGIEFPWKYSVILEPSYTHTAVLHGPPAETIGFTIQKHLAMPFALGGTQ